ncbi:MAG: bifunctional indole-3-glycerol-phosphate synthase TrpC/phosphoribosylanthranilate isomerase TrpF [Alphaproteobacteria bacterium]
MAEGVLAEIVRRKRHDVRQRLDGRTLDPQPTRRSLRSILARPGARFVMEVKRRSPSGHFSNVSVAEAVSAYAPVADAISVLTDGPFFGGSFQDLRTARERFDGPILAKDFVLDPRQVAEARMRGADAVLAILGALGDDEAKAIMAEARRLSMDVVVEVHNERELKRALALGAGIVGVNNRDLRTLKTDLAVAERLAGLVPEDRVLISESGIRSRDDVERLSTSVDAFLVGSSLMAADHIAQAARALVYGNVKICGLTREEDVELVAEAGATHVGLIFVEDSPRRIGGEAARIAATARRHGLRSVGVFRGQPEELIARMARDIGLDAVQLHDRELDLRQLRLLMRRECEIWAVCGVGETAEPARLDANRSLFDSMVKGRTGGTGRPFDWSLIAGRIDQRRAFLAGGIGPDNARAAQRMDTFGIDVGSRIESAPGRKDPDKLKALFAALRPSCRRTAPC